MDIRKIQSACLRQKTGLLSTNSHIFNGTIRDNLLIARPYATAREMDSALQAAQLLTYVQGLSDGLDTRVGEDGALLSGGQRQRLALARMLLADKPVLVFDEATSNIDCESEEMIWESIGALKGKKTVIVISHRLASVKEADRIYVLDKGVIAQSGTHDDLIACSGAYSRMWAMQQELENIKGGKRHEKGVRFQDYGQDAKNWAHWGISWWLRYCSIWMLVKLCIINLCYKWLRLRHKDSYFATDESNVCCNAIYNY